MKRIFSVLQLLEENDNKIEILKNNMDEELYCFFTMFYEDVNYNISKRTFQKLVYTSEKYDDPGLLVMNHITPGDDYINFNEFLKCRKTVINTTGNDVIEYLKKELSKYKKNNIKWIIRFFNKDLRIGIQLKTINKVLDELHFERIEKFEVQLCGSFNTIEDVSLEYPLYVSIKYDGLRCIVKKVDDVVTLYSRSGKIIKYLPEIEEELLLIPYNFMIDGEVLAKDFATIQKRIGRKHDTIEPVTDLCYKIFDVIEFDNHKLNKRYILERFEYLRHFDELMYCTPEHGVVCNNFEELKDFYEEAIDNKEEGIIIKKLHSPYSYGDRKNWFKIKKHAEATFKIINYDYGEGKYSKHIAKLQIEDASGNVQAWVGSGVSLEDIEVFEYFQDKNSLIGKFCDIKYMEITHTSNGYFLRHPVFRKIREDKEAADALIQ